MTTALMLIAAVVMDAVFGEMRRAHPLVLFGRMAVFLETRLWRNRRWAGVVAWVLTVVPLVLLAWWIEQLLGGISAWLSVGFTVVLTWVAIGLRSLGEHARPVASALAKGDLETAREAVGRIVGRNAAVLDADQVAVAATESVLENGNDAVFGALFWAALLGAPGVVLYRLANTLDAMWGHHNARYGYFGWAAARADDALNFIPARLVALTYALCGRFEGAWHAWRTQARHWVSPNAGPVMAAGAGALGVELGGRAPYQGQWIERPQLGAGEAPNAYTIDRAMRLVRRGVVAWLVVALVVGVVTGVSHA
ncbi:MAG TPA: adenosylcobinamide-phosphate synthase CbiB [Oleiagrimonas sp.]|nr:adenosylcobinamide-phosphate synthase CbiB [Oleiagrimonas sp.]